MDACNYFRSDWAWQRGGAALFVGYTMAQIPAAQRRAINADTACNGAAVAMAAHFSFLSHQHSCISSRTTSRTCAKR